MDFPIQQPQTCFPEAYSGSHTVLQHENPRCFPLTREVSLHSAYKYPADPLSYFLLRKPPRQVLFFLSVTSGTDILQWFLQSSGFRLLYTALLTSLSFHTKPHSPSYHWGLQTCQFLFPVLQSDPPYFQTAWLQFLFRFDPAEKFPRRK